MATEIDRVPSTSADPLYVWVEGYTNPTGAPIRYCLQTGADVEPPSAAYVLGEWVTDPITPNVPAVAGTATVPAQKGRWLARLAKGPGSPFPLLPGSVYEVFVKTDLDGGVHLAGVVRTL